MDTIESLRNENAALKQLHQVVEEGQLRFKTVFENSSLGNKILNLDLEILQVNKAMVDLLGYDSKQDIIGSKILDFAPDNRHSEWKYLQGQLWMKQTPSFNLETQLIKKDGTIIWCRVTSILFPDNGQTLGYTIIEDITEQVNLRKQKEEFITVASHELRTPVTTLAASLQIANTRLTASSMADPVLTRMMSTAEKNASKLTYLLNDLLDVTKIEGGQLQLNKTLFPISNVLEGCCNHISDNEKIIITNKGDHSLVVFADLDKISQVLVNLVNNVVKYAPQSNEIIIEVQKVSAVTKILVSDTGPGIPQEILPFLFERYYRAENDRNKNSGLGLGLYISDEIIKRHGGEMGVNSIVGEGSTFWFTIPD
jgi:PAS domain S-box-containing protein